MYVIHLLYCTNLARSASCLSLGQTQASLEVLCLGLPVLSPPCSFTLLPPPLPPGMGMESPTGLELALLVPPTPPPPEGDAKLLAPGTVRDFRRSETIKGEEGGGSLVQ